MRTVVGGYLHLGRNKWLKVKPTKYVGHGGEVVYINDIVLTPDLPALVRQRLESAWGVLSEC